MSQTFLLAMQNTFCLFVCEIHVHMSEKDASTLFLDV